MNRRGFTFAGFFGTLGAAIGKALGYDGTPEKPLSKIMSESLGQFIDVTTGTDAKYSIKVGRKIMTLPHGVMGSGGWDVYADTAETAARSHEEADIKERIDRQHWLAWKDEIKLQPLQPRERLVLPPPEFKRWSEAPAVMKPTLGGMKIDIRHFRDDLEHILTLENLFEIRGAVHELYSRADAAIRRQESFCDGHHGPSPGLTAEHCMTEMNDGRRLCPYCYNQEIQDGRSAVTS